METSALAVLSLLPIVVVGLFLVILRWPASRAMPISYLVAALFAFGVGWFGWILAQAEPAKEMPPTTRAIAMMALLGIALLGMLLVVIILLGGHWVRRQGYHRRGPAVPPDLILKKNPPSDQPNLPEGENSTNETAITDNTRNS